MTGLIYLGRVTPWIDKRLLTYTFSLLFYFYEHLTYRNWLP